MRKYITKASERIGVESTSRDGKRAQVVSYSTCENFIIRFCDGKEMKLKNWRYFIEGNFNYEKHFKAPRNREERIGEKKVMNNGLTAEVIEYRGSHDMDILFEDGEKRTGVSWRDFCIGNIAHPTIHGGNVSQNELVLRFYLESLGFVRIPQRSKRSDRVGLEGKELDKFINFEKDKRTIKEYVSNNKRATIHLYEKKKMNNGMVAEIIKMSSCRNITVQFEDGEIVYHKCYQSFVKGNISHPKDTSLAKKNQRLNLRKQMKNGMMAEVIEYNLSNDIKVKFDNGEIVKTRWERFSTGSVAVPSCYARNHIGDKKIQNRGNEEAEIIEVKDANHITVKFKDGTIVKDRKYEDFIHGAIGKPGIPQLRRTLKNERLWTEKIMRNGMKAKIVRYGSANDIDIKFSNGTIVMHKTYANFCSGSVACK